MLYFVRCIRGNFQIAIFFRGALAQLKLAGPDAAVYSMTGKWIAGRRFREVAPC